VTCTVPATPARATVAICVRTEATVNEITVCYRNPLWSRYTPCGISTRIYS
jgi:hypothetical protein